MKSPDPSEKTCVWITPHEAAAYLGVGVDIIYDGSAAGGLKHTRLGHRTSRRCDDSVETAARAVDYKSENKFYAPVRTYTGLRPAEVRAPDDASRCWQRRPMISSDVRPAW
jgi:excisionase family DNA binding protein